MSDDNKSFELNENKIQELASKMIDFGQSSMEFGMDEEDKLMICRGNILHLIGGMLRDNENDLYELEAYLQYFTAKKIMDSISPSQLLMAKGMDGGMGQDPMGNPLASLLGGTSILDMLQSMMNDMNNSNDDDEDVDSILDKYTGGDDKPE